MSRSVYSVSFWVLLLHTGKQKRKRNWMIKQIFERNEINRSCWTTKSRYTSCYGRKLNGVVTFDNIPTNMAAKLIEGVGNICDRISS